MTTENSPQDGHRALPPDFITRIEGYGADALVGLCDALSTTAPAVSVRVNTAKGVSVPDNADKVPWSDTGFYLNRREAFTFDPALHQGLYYPQDASSMIVGTIAGMLTGTSAVRYLDACAAPGGKTTAALSQLPAGSLVVANEYVPARAAVLAENVAKWGYDNVIVSRGDTARFRKLRNFFNIIAADVPCSGEGMMRKDAEAVSQWSPSLVRECAQRQREIIDNLWPALCPGGLLIYSTCTFNTDENEEMLAYLRDNFGAELVELDLDTRYPGIQRGITEHNMPAYRFMPQHLRGEGLFVAVVRKPGDPASSSPVKNHKPARTDRRKPVPGADKAASWLHTPGDYRIDLDENDIVRALPSSHSSAFDTLKGSLDIVSTGITLATIKGKDIIPTQQLALSTALSPDAFSRFEVDYPSAVTYLRREAVSLPDDCPRGFVLLTYNNRPLGFVKNLGNRANNLYPQPWRILSAHVPGEPPHIIN